MELDETVCSRSRSPRVRLRNMNDGWKCFRKSESVGNGNISDAGKMTAADKSRQNLHSRVCDGPDDGSGEIVHARDVAETWEDRETRLNPRATEKGVAALLVERSVGSMAMTMTRERDEI